MKKSGILILIILVVLIGIVDQKISYWSHSTNAYNEEEKIIPFQIGNEEEKISIPDPNSLKARFGLNELLHATYSNGKLLYLVPKEDNFLRTNIKGIVVVENKLPLHAKYIRCEDYHLDKKIRDRYPNSRIKELGVVISDANTPYGKFAIIEIKNAKPYVERIVLKKLVDEAGEDIFEFKVSELPKFAE